MIEVIALIGLFLGAAKATAPAIENPVEKVEKVSYAVEYPTGYVLYKDAWGDWSAYSKFPE